MQETHLDQGEAILLAQQIAELASKLDRACHLCDNHRLTSSIRSIQSEAGLIIELLDQARPDDSIDVLAIRNGWKVGEPLSIKALVLNSDKNDCAVLPGQPIPEGARISLGIRGRDFRAHDQVELTLKLARGKRRLKWNLLSIVLLERVKIAPTMGPIPNHPPSDVDEFLLRCRDAGRICPALNKWRELLEILKDANGFSFHPKEIPAWGYSTDNRKMNIFEDHIRYAESLGLEKKVLDHLENLQASEWYYGD
jgi:hypothetical protein